MEGGTEAVEEGRYVHAIQRQDSSVGEAWGGGEGQCSDGRIDVDEFGEGICPLAFGRGGGEEKGGKRREEREGKGEARR
jgi:hypothetical protein